MSDQHIVSLCVFTLNCLMTYGEHQQLRHSLTQMKYKERLERVYDMTFPNKEYQPMSPNFTDKNEYCKAIRQFIFNLQSLDEYCFCRDTNQTNEPSLKFYYLLQRKSDELTEFIDFIKLHCPTNIALYYVRHDEYSLELTCDAT